MCLQCDTLALVRTISETFKGLGLSQQLALGSTKAMFAGWYGACYGALPKKTNRQFSKQVYFRQETIQAMLS